MHLKVNGKSYQTNQANTLADLLGEMEGYNQESIAVAVNEKIVPKTEWKNFELKEGSEIEVVRPVQGG